MRRQRAPDPGGMTIRPARVGEHVELTQLAFRSAQQAWGYSDEFMAWEPEAITVTPSHISDAITNVLEREGRILGFYVLRSLPPGQGNPGPHDLEMEMSRLMIEPLEIGLGYGRILWNHAVSTARQVGVRAITLDADPNAEAFYRHQGAETVGEYDWEPPMMPGWRVKKMRYSLC